jgi:RNA polymerase sigma factor (sigma-70 family)
MDFAELPYNKLSPAAEAFALDILNKANALLLKWSKRFPDIKYRDFRNKVFSNPKAIFVFLSSEEQNQFEADLPIMGQARKPHAELNGKTVEMAMLESNAALAKKYARKWSRESGKGGLMFEDFLQEAYMQIVESIYRWTAEGGANMTTYLWWSLKNRLSNVANQQGSFLSRLSNNSIKLLDRYQKAKAAIEWHASFDQVCASISLSDEERLHLLDILKQTNNASAMCVADDGESEFDYTAHRSNINDHSETDSLVEKMTVEEILDQSNLSPIERELIETAMNPYNGWQTAIGRKHIAPKTGKPYSRMRITQILKQAREKVDFTMSRIHDRN